MRNSFPSSVFNLEVSQRRNWKFEQLKFASQLCIFSFPFDLDKIKMKELDSELPSSLPLIFFKVNRRLLFLNSFLLISFLSKYSIRLDLSISYCSNSDICYICHATSILIMPSWYMCFSDFITFLIWNQRIQGRTYLNLIVVLRK